MASAELFSSMARLRASRSKLAIRAGNIPGSDGGGAMWDFEKKRHRDLLAEACADMRSYQANPYATQRLAEAKPGVGVSVKRTPSVLRIEQVDGRWWANDKTIGPFDTVRDLEIAVLGRSDLQGGKRDFRDGPPSKED
jgi:hypothetical protein